MIAKRLATAEVLTGVAALLVIVALGASLVLRGEVANALVVEVDREAPNRLLIFGTVSPEASVQVHSNALDPKGSGKQSVPAPFVVIADKTGNIRTSIRRDSIVPLAIVLSWEHKNTLFKMTKTAFVPLTTRRTNEYAE